MLVSLDGLYSLYNEELIRSVSIKQVTIRTDRTNRQHTVPRCHNEMHAPYVLKIRTVSNSDDLYGAYDPSTALSIRTATIRTGVRDCGDAVLRYFWCGFAVIFILTRGIAVSKHQAVCGYYNL